VFARRRSAAVLNDATIPVPTRRVVCGGANDQLAEVRHDAALAVHAASCSCRTICECRRVIDFHQETIDGPSPARCIRFGSRASAAITREAPALRRRDRRHP